MDNGRLFFTFEGDREVRYLFEAQQIIDEPRWESCDLKGFYLDHSLEYYIGLAKAERRDTKSGKPEWCFKGKYDLKYKRPDFWQDKTVVYPVNQHNKKVYADWEAQRDIALDAQRKADEIAKQLTKGDN